MVSVYMLNQITFVLSSPKVSSICWVPSVLQDTSQFLWAISRKVGTFDAQSTLSPPKKKLGTGAFSHLLCIQLGEKLW